MSEILTDAWHTIVPDRASRHGPLPPLMLVLTLVTGFVDAYSYLMLGHVFVANMTGNVVFCGFAIAGSAGFSLVASLVALAAFAAGAGLGGRLARTRREHRGRLLHAALLVQTTLMLAAYLVGEFGPATDRPAARYPLIVLLGVAMGVQNASARVLAVPDMTTTVLTMTITGTSADSRVVGGPGGKAGRRLLSIGAMFLGALLGALAILHGHPALCLLGAVLLLAATTAVTARTTRSSAGWTKP